MEQPDVIVIGSGVGGGIVSRRLAESGARVLLLERGDFVPREPENWSVETVFFEKKYKARDTWLDRTGRSFDPGMYYNVGGATKFYGGAMFRLRLVAKRACARSRARTRDPAASVAPAARHARYRPVSCALARRTVRLPNEYNGLLQP